ncbi:MAG TPA: SPOR domain-containing protein [Burkholderiales bacterium]|nr:SPOR domain-containing protein [Burkholderiales bacterium]
MAESQEIGALRRRGRRRLVGAIALVLLAVIVLPMVFDAEPRQGTPAVSVRIPSEDDAGFSPKPAPKAPAAPPVAAIPKPEPQKPALESKAEEKPQQVAKQDAPAAQRENPRAESAPAGGEKFYFQVGAFSDPAKVKEVTGKLKSAGLPYFTEQVAVSKGQATRVRVGPYADRAAAEKAAEQVKTLGLKPGNVTGRS